MKISYEWLLKFNCREDNTERETFKETKTDRIQDETNALADR